MNQFDDSEEDEDRAEDEDDADSDEDEMEMAYLNDLIVDEEEVEEVNEHGAPARQRLGISPSALQEGREISSDFDDLVRLGKLEVRHRKSGTNYVLDEDNYELLNYLLDQDDCMFLREKYVSVSRPKLHMYQKPDAIWKMDIPERMQISEESTGHPPTDKTSVNIEADWIYNELLMVPLMFSKSEKVDDELKRHIARFLELMHVQKLDVPFIAMYRKEEILSLLKDPIKFEADIENDPNKKLKWHELLWAIKDLDVKWLLLRKRKSTLQSCYTEHFKEVSSGIHDETRLKQVFESITESLKAADSEIEVEDVDLKFKLHFPKGEVIQGEGQYEIPKWESRYRICSKAGLSEVASKFGHSSEEFGSLISQEKKRTYILDDPSEKPEEIASHYTGAMFGTPEDVLKGARHMAAVEINCEPCIRKHVRRIFMENAVVSTSPTPDGNTAVDCFHQFSGVKCLREKPLSRFEDAQWLLIQKAEEEKLFQVTIKLPDVVVNKLISKSNIFYLSYVSKSAQLWNEHRKLILHDAFHNFLLPSMEKESRSLLTGRAKAWVRREYGKLLWDKVSVSPKKWKENRKDNIIVDKTTAPTVMACCWEPGNPATTFVMLDSVGGVVDVLQADSPLQFMMEHKPRVVVLGAANLSCRPLRDEIFKVLFHMAKDSPINVDFINVDESLPRLYESSCIAADQFPSQEGIIRRAIALGRYYQHPLAMAATLCGRGREILLWELTSYDTFLTPDEKYGMVEQVMIDVTNQLGVDIDWACNIKWWFAPLQFISGLGPEKAASLRRSLEAVGSFRLREDLKTRHGLGHNIFTNSAGFFPVPAHGLPYSTNLLDETRIHPESYRIAVDLARNIYEEDGRYLGSTDYLDVVRLVIGHIRLKPHLLRAVNLHEYAEKNNLLDKKETLNDIILELIQPYGDRRRPYAPLR